MYWNLFSALCPKIKLLNHNPHIIHHLASLVFIPVLFKVASDEELSAGLRVVGNDLTELAPGDAAVETRNFLGALVDIICDENGAARVVVLERLKFGLAYEAAVDHDFVHSC